MALKAVQIAGIGIPNVGGQVPENASLCSTRFPQGVEMGRGGGLRPAKFVVIGHRGNGMNVLQSPDRRMKAFKENSILSFNAAADYLVDFIEFDVQVTKDDCPVIFHDDFILSKENDMISEKRITELSLAEFLSYGPQKGSGSGGKPLVRKTIDGKVVGWCVEIDDALCTLQEALEKVNPSLGFNIELKFDDYLDYEEEELLRVLRRVLQVVRDHGKDRPILFSTFQPDAALLVKKLQSAYPVLFLTNGGTEVYSDVRRNSLEEAVKLCVEGGLEGVVSEVKGVFMNPGAVKKMKESNLSLFTYGKLNNVAEAVYIQHLMGIDGVIVDFVQEITQAVGHMLKPPSSDSEEEEQNPQFSPMEMSFLMKLIPQLLIQQH
ncbi:PREDICTED: glycerophosphodiester phosphodiesterase GDPD1, chloroplastic-like [Ipomoea nil]|uniref:glycerophosphodiester phosphodiesterase GDPD1, chloroplastic-like n=1 Tax=Ipomoea nil TaxID=35883 RepID=UPI000900C5D3|nr:PREDICTED: glycerophosphodiester phosphodiesterase GDPD1, chloroplastic-like [Ipomoea nil]